jgi:hypothetical protein
MATTTNYGWTTPDDTALVKDGASAIRTLGSSVDTSVKALNPGTTSGDLDYYTAATTKARIAKGTAGQVFTMNSGATAPEWQTISAGGMTLLSTTTLSGASTTISSISGSYNKLLIIVTGVTNATADGQFRIAPNALTNITDFSGMNNASTFASDQNGYINLTPTGGATSNLLRTNADNAFAIDIYNYASATSTKPFRATAGFTNTSSKSGFFNFGNIRTNSAITSLVFSNSGGNLSTGTVLLYGVK